MGPGGGTYLRDVVDPALRGTTNLAGCSGPNARPGGKRCGNCNRALRIFSGDVAFRLTGSFSDRRPVVDNAAKSRAVCIN